MNALAPQRTTANPTCAAPAAIPKSCFGNCEEGCPCIEVRKRRLARVVRTSAARLLRQAMAAFEAGADALRELLAAGHGWDGNCECAFCNYINQNPFDGNVRRWWDTLAALRVMTDDATDNIKSSVPRSMGGY